MTALDYPEIDLTNAGQVRSLVRTHQPQAIINATAYTAVDRAESEPEIAMAINARAPGLLAEEARRLGALLIHYSTDYVFDGKRAVHTWKATCPTPWEYTGRASSKESGSSRRRAGIP